MSHMQQMQQNGTPAYEHMSEPFARPDIIDYGTYPIKLQVRLTFSCRYATMCLYSSLYCWVPFCGPAGMMWSKSIFSSPLRNCRGLHKGCANDHANNQELACSFVRVVALEAYCNDCIRAPKPERGNGHITRTSLACIWRGVCATH